MRNFIAAAALLACACASAQSVALQGMMGGRALLIVNGGAPRWVSVGDAVEGVKVVSTAGDAAVVEVAGERFSLRVGDAPASVGQAPGRGNRIVLAAASGGHFSSQGAINGRTVQFLVDTGATWVSLGASDADRLGISYRGAPTGRMGTANGVVEVWRVKLDSVRVGDVELFAIDAVVVPAQMPFVLLGNSFLSRFRMTRTQDEMVLERRF